MPAEKGAKLIADDIVKEAKEKATQTIRAAKKDATRMLEAARLSVREAEKSELDEARARGKRIYDELMSEGRMEARREVLRKKEEIITDVFRRAEERLKTHIRSKEYRRDLVRIAAGACKKLGSGDVIIRANERDLKILRESEERIIRELAEGGKAPNLSFGEPIHTIGGVKVRTPEGKVEIDETFEGRIRREFEGLRVKVAKVLFEGSG